MGGALVVQGGGGERVSTDRSEKRDDQRVPGSFPVRFRVEGRTGSGMALDLSAGGMLLETAMPIDPGQSLTLEVEVPNYPPLELEGLVVEIRPTGVGVRFPTVTRGHRIFLNAYTAVLLAPPWERGE